MNIDKVDCKDYAYLMKHFEQDLSHHVFGIIYTVLRRKL